MKKIELSCFGIVVILEREDPDRPGLYFTGRIESELEREEYDKTWNAALDGVESMILAHACAGVDITTPAYIEGIETSVEKIEQFYG